MSNSKSLLLVPILLFTLHSCSTPHEGLTSTREKDYTVISNPIEVHKEDSTTFFGTDNLIFLPENRKSAETRSISVHFMHFPAKKDQGRPPVFYLPAGPGFCLDVEYLTKESWKAMAISSELAHYNETRDVVVLNQRGNPDNPGASIPDFSYECLRAEQAVVFAERMEDYAILGVDVQGYDFISLVEDVEDVRKYLGAAEIALLGSSFGSQWALGYMKMYPEHVDRAILAGVEPLSHSLDDPKGLWNYLGRTDAYCQKDSSVVPHLPEVGLQGALQAIVKRLEAKPEKVRLVYPPYDLDTEVTITAEEFLNCRVWQRNWIWPKYITEIYNGDYRYPALWIWENTHQEQADEELMIASLIDGSLGISDSLAKTFESAPEKRWIGNGNQGLKSVLPLLKDIDVGDDFRAPIHQEIPLLMIQGDLDGSTPLENAQFLLPYFKNSHLITCYGGYHSSKLKLFDKHPEERAQVLKFMDADFKLQSFESIKESLPDSCIIDDLEFFPMGGASLFEQALEADS